MQEHVARDLLCEIGRRAYARRLVSASEGNFSCRLDGSTILLTPTGICKGFMQPHDLVKVSLSGEVLEAGKRASSELPMYLTIYKHRPEVRGVVHAHPVYATAFAITGTPVPNGILPEVEVFLGEVPTAPYALTGTQAFGDVLVPYLAEHQVLLLQNHGALALGPDLFTAYYRMETLDHYCQMLLAARALGELQRLTDAQVQELLDLKARMGLPDRRHAPNSPINKGG
ncbi:class II aldolase/adducin family protein [bacterium]|nr:class II aldolase/adducin family protein [bacterium]